MNTKQEVITGSSHRHETPYKIIVNSNHSFAVFSAVPNSGIGINFIVGYEAKIVTEAKF